MIDDDGFILWESMTINLYPAKKYSPGGLYPDRLEAEARAPQWSFWGMAEVEPPSRTAQVNRVGYPGRERPGGRGCGQARTRRSSRGVMWEAEEVLNQYESIPSAEDHSPVPHLIPNAPV